MRKFLIGAATIAALAAVPTAASAQASTATGVAVGAGTGFVIGGPPGAVVGAIIGGGVGAAHEPRYYADPYAPAYVAPSAGVVVRTEPSERCWRDRWNRTVCDYR